jgi:hypothetical protein
VRISNWSFSINCVPFYGASERSSPCLRHALSLFLFRSCVSLTLVWCGASGSERHLLLMLLSWVPKHLLPSSFFSFAPLPPLQGLSVALFPFLLSLSKYLYIIIFLNSFSSTSLCLTHCKRFSNRLVSNRE